MRAMKAVRLGSYSSRSTTAGTSCLRRRKSTRRYACLCPPPMWRVVMRPSLLRPPVLVLPSVSILTGAPFHRPLRSTSTRCRRPGEVGRKVLRAICLSPLETGRDVDRVAFLERHDGLLGIALLGASAAEGLHLALAHQRVDRLHLDAEEALHRGLDLRLGRLRRHLEDDLVRLRDERRLLGDHRRLDDVVSAELHAAASLLAPGAVASAKRSSSASSAAFVST